MAGGLSLFCTAFIAVHERGRRTDLGQILFEYISFLLYNDINECHM